MKICKMVGLVGAGGVNQSFLARMPALLRRLGPIKGSSLRVSRRIANGLRAGSAVTHHTGLQACECIWIYAPEETLDRVAADLAREVSLHGKSVVLCDVMRDSLRPGPLRTAGARVATLNCVPESEEQVFVAEGHPAVVAELRKGLALDGRKLIELRPGKKTLYLLGTHLASYLLMPPIAGAVESFRAAGFPRRDAVRLVQALGTRALRSYGAAGNRAWNPHDAERMARAIDADMETSSHAARQLAALHAEGSKRLRGLIRQRSAKATAETPPAKLVARKAS